MIRQFHFARAEYDRNSYDHCPLILIIIIKAFLQAFRRS